MCTSRVCGPCAGDRRGRPSHGPGFVFPFFLKIFTLSDCRRLVPGGHLLARCMAPSCLSRVAKNASPKCRHAAGGSGVARACHSLLSELLEKVASSIKLAADKARFCMTFRSLCKPPCLKACFLLHLTECLEQEKPQLVSLACFALLLCHTHPLRATALDVPCCMKPYLPAAAHPSERVSRRWGCPLRARVLAYKHLQRYQAEKPQVRSPVCQDQCRRPQAAVHQAENARRSMPAEASQ